MAAAIPFIAAGMSAMSSMSASADQEAQLDGQALALEGRAYALQKEGFAHETSIRKQKDQVIGQTTSAAAGAGVDTSSGSVLDVIEDSAFNIEMDALTTRQSYANQADALKTEAHRTRQGKPSGSSVLLGGASAGFSGFAGAGGFN